jgi:hypothetical protein
LAQSVLNKLAAMFFPYFPTNEFPLPSASPAPTFTRIRVLASTAGVVLTNRIHRHLAGVGSTLATASTPVSGNPSEVF